MQTYKNKTNKKKILKFSKFKKFIKLTINEIQKLLSNWIRNIKLWDFKSNSTSQYLKW